MPARLEMPNPPTLEGVVRLLIGYLKSGQAVQSISSDGATCFYRGPNGAQCFVGLFIPDELYKDEYNIKCIADVFEDAPEIKVLLCSNVIRLETWAALQNVHDNAIKSNFARDALRDLETFSRVRELDIPSSEFQLD